MVSVIMQLVTSVMVVLTLAEVWAQSPDLTVIEIYPCDNATTDKVSRFKSDVYVVKSSFQHCQNISGDQNSNIIGVRVKSRVIEPINKYVVFVTRSNSGSYYWTIPFHPQGIIVPFNVVHQTMCPMNSTNLNGTNGRKDDDFLYIDVFTSSLEDVFYEIQVEVVQNFVLQVKNTFSVMAGAATPQIYYFKFSGNIKKVAVEVESESKTCAIISVQENICPINVLVRNAKSNGRYQTMIKSAYMIVSEDQMTVKDFVLVVIIANYLTCYRQPSDGIIQGSEYTKDIKITLHDISEPTYNFAGVSLIPIIFSILHLIVVLLYCLFIPHCLCSCCTKECKLKECKLKVCKKECKLKECKLWSTEKCKLSCTVMEMWCTLTELWCTLTELWCILTEWCKQCINRRNKKTEESDLTKPLLAKGSKPLDKRSAATSGVSETAFTASPDGAGAAVAVVLSTSSETGTAIEPITPATGLSHKTLDVSHARDLDQPGSGQEARAMSVEDGLEHEAAETFQLNVTLPVPASGSSAGSPPGGSIQSPGDGSSAGQEKTQHMNYCWNTVTIGIFYGLPAIQMIFSYLLEMKRSGIEDLCYYNFKCAHPFWIFPASNNILSNSMYMIFGFIFLLIVFCRHRPWCKTSCCKTRENNDNKEEYGVPQFYGIYYGLGAAIIIEGFMSSFYHICPTNANYQFDTTFMFIIGGLFILKLMQNRHPNINEFAFMPFFVVTAVIVFLTLIGLYCDSTCVRCGIFIPLFLIIMAFLGVFFLYSSSFDNITEVSFEQAKRNFQERKKKQTPCPGDKCQLFCMGITRIILPLIINSILLYDAIENKDFDFATQMLVFFIANFAMFLFAYSIHKPLIGKEKTTDIIVVLFILVNAMWIIALFMFKCFPTSNWQDTPAQSRGKNKDCIFLDFYDHHDVWHFLSANALFFTCLFLLVLDDGVKDKKRKNIKVF